MNTFNNFSPLAFREKSQKATYKKWYAYGKEFALPFSTTELPPFQFTVANLPSFDPTTVEVFLVNEATGVRSGTGIKIKVDTMDKHNSVLYVSPGSNVYAKSMEPGVYRAEFAIPEGETYVSTPICVTEGIETNTNFVKLEYWNDEKLAYPNGFVTTGTDNDFKFQMYIPTTFFKPKYEFEEEITKRAGYKFLELQTCNKVFGFNFLAPEYICDALRLVRLSDYIRFTHDGEYYNALNFEYNPDWQDNGYLAAIECQFETDTIIQKLPSFNRRDRESFYNALLADIDTPILFSPDVVGLYYREFKQGEPTIKGKLIRELSPIDLIDENTTIAVDMGAGEARKFNLYRMLEGYISKNHEDVTEFLLSLRGGVNIGTPNTSGEYPASVDRDGNAKLKDVQGNDATLNKVTGKDATFKTVETGFLTVNKTSATIDGMGNANVNDLTARGDSMLRSDVYTGSKNGSHTGKITKEGQLQYLSAIIYEFLSSETFVPGFLGEGFKIWLENGNWHIECDNLTVRQTMNIFELLIQKIRSVNGAIVVSQSNGKVTAVEDAGTQYKITFGEEFPTFQEGDLIRCQSWSKNVLKFYWVEVKTAADGYVLCDKSEFNNVVPAVGDEVVQMGNTKNAERQALIYITAQESGKPYIEILNGVKTKSLTGTDRTRLGDLSNIVDPDFTGEAAVKGTGFYSTNAFLKGIFVLRSGKRVEDEIKIAKDAADQAAQDAANAAQSAQEAKDRLNKWADDGFISPTEKPALIDEGKRIQAEYLQIKANADKYGVLVTEYTEAYNNYLNELRYHSAATPEDIAVRPELAQSQTTYYDKRNGALNAIANAAKSYVDEADKKLKEYLDTEITAIPGKIELAVRSLKTADTNLLKGAFREITNASYNIGYYNYDVPVINGKEYTLTVCYTLSSENKRISAYSNRGINFLVDFNTKGNMVVESKKVTMVGYKPTEGLYFFQFPQGIYGSKVHWAVLTDGNLGVTSWIPSASERVAGIKNLCSFKRITDAGFTYLSNYKDDGRFYVDPGLLHQQSTLADKDMFGLTYDPAKRYYIFIDKAFRSDTENEISTMFTVHYTDGTAEPICYVKPNEIIYNFCFTSKPVSKITGSYGYGYGTTMRVGVYETNFPVSWSPAPEDQLYQSMKYTDTQILAVDGKIELSVKTKVENLGIGANNLFSYTSSPLNQMSPEPMTVTRLISEHGFHLVGAKGGQSHVRIPNVIPPIPGKYTVSGWIKGSQNTRVGFTIDVCDSENVIVKSTADNQWSYFKHTFNVTENTEGQKDVYNFVDIERIDWAYIWVKDFKVEAGEIATAWSPNEADSVYFSKEYTTSQIDIVEGKITSTVEQINSVDGKVTGLASRVTQTESSINSVVGDINTLNNTTERKVAKRIDLTGWDNNKFYPLVINLFMNNKNKIEISRPLDISYGKPSYCTHDEGFSMDLTFEMSGSGWGASVVVTNIFDYYKRWTAAGAKIVVDLGQITESSQCVMGIRGGSKYDVAISGWTDPNVVNVFSADYTSKYGQVYPVRTDGTEPERTYGYYTEIKQERDRITATAEKVDEQGNRLSAAELTLSSDHAKLGVVEQTATSANNKADATNNGLVETGINITSRKIVLKSDNVLFQNNAGQQTAALNANGRLTANVIEAGEVVANGFAAQRITTGNLTVTDGAVIAGMSISGGVLRGSNVELTNGAKIGSFIISNGIFSAQGVPAGMQMSLGSNLSTFDSSGVKIDHNSGGYALTTNGNGRIYLKGSAFWTECQDYEFIGATSWKAPGVFYAATILSNGNIGRTWGNPDFHITRVDHTATGTYTIHMSGNVGGVFPTLTCYDLTKWAYPAISLLSENSISYKTVDISRQLVDCGICIHFCGMV
ncbi:tail fiber protein [Bacteroides phage BF486P1]|nr:tail fiber protein [Bacteroides phage BF486P1]